MSDNTGRETNPDSSHEDGNNTQTDQVDSVFDGKQVLEEQLKDQVGLSKYLTEEELQEISPFNQFRMVNEMRNHDVFIKLGIKVKTPQFMMNTREEKLLQQQQAKIDNEERKKEQKKTNYESNDEWTPSPKKRRGKVPQFKPVKKKSTHSKKPKFQAPKTTSTDSTPEEVTTSRYPKRAKARGCNYMDLEVPDDDTFLYCEECNFEYHGDCPTHGPLKIVSDPQVRKNTPGRATQTLPPFLYLKESHLPFAGTGVFTKERIESRTRFGPYEGVHVGQYGDAHISGYSWQVYEGFDDKHFHFVDAGNASTSNWMRYVNCARNEDEQNLQAYQHFGQIYYRTYKHITPGMELLVYYGNGYAKELGIDRLQKMTDKGTAFKCDHCQLAFTTPRFLHLHKKGRHGFHFDTTIEKHGKRSHDVVEQTVGDGRTAKRHQCTECLYSSDNSGSLHQHMVTHTGERRFKCSECCKKFNDKSNLQKHKLTHSGEKCYRCGICDKRFSQKGHLKSHLRIHTGDKPYKCTECSKAFTTTTNLTVHMRVHTGQKPFTCFQCDKAFTHSSNLTVHMRIHSGDKPFKCGQCETSFSHSSHLRRHIFTHSDVKPRHCTRCDYSCIEASNMKRHIRVHHKQNEE